MPTTVIRPPATHVHISEREVAHTWPDGRHDDAHWEDCAWASAVMWARASGHPEIPATHAEAEALRAQAGAVPDGRGDSAKVPLGLLRRYRIVVNFVRGWPALAVLLKPGTVASVAGSMGVFPDGHPLRRWDPPFRGNHQVLVFRLDSAPRVWWDDPLAPDGYRGQWVSISDLAWFVKAIDGGHLVAPIKVPPTPVARAVIDRLRFYISRLSPGPKLTAYRARLAEYLSRGR